MRASNASHISLPALAKSIPRLSRESRQPCPLRRLCRLLLQAASSTRSRLQAPHLGHCWQRWQVARPPGCADQVTHVSAAALLFLVIFAKEKGWIAPFPVSEKAWYCSSAPARTNTCLRDTANVLFHNRKLQGALLHFPPPVVRLMAFCLLTPSASHLHSPLSYMPNRATHNFLPLQQLITGLVTIWHVKFIPLLR